MAAKKKTDQEAESPSESGEGQGKKAGLEALLTDLAGILQNASTDEDRRNFIMRLQGQAVPAVEAEKITLATFKVSKQVFEEDLLWIQDYWQSYIDEGGSKARKQEVLAYNAELLRRAMAGNDLATAQKANQHRAQLLRLE